MQVFLPILSIDIAVCLVLALNHSMICRFNIVEGIDSDVIDPAVEIHADEVTTLTGHDSEVFVVHWNPKVFFYHTSTLLA